MAEEAERSEPSSQRKRHATAWFSSRNERARSKVNARAAGCDRGAERALVPAGFRSSAPDKMTDLKADAARGQQQQSCEI